MVSGVIGALIASAPGVASASHLGENVATAASACTFVADNSGSNANSGDPGHPFQTVSKLVASLHPGDIGCLAGGQTFNENVVDMRQQGTIAHPITLTSGPGGRATFRGRLVLWDTSSDIVVRDLSFNGHRLNGTHADGPQINGTRIRFTNDDITNENTGICVGIGHWTDADFHAVATDVEIDHSTIHNCGPAGNGAHGIYIESSIRTVVHENYIYDNGARGVQFYPDAQDSQVVHNVIDGNGEGVNFGGTCESPDVAARCAASSNNVVRSNIITNSQIRANVEANYDDARAQPSGNTVDHNCVWHPATGYDNLTDTAFYSHSNNSDSDPMYVNAAAHDYTLQAGSPCSDYGPSDTEAPTVASLRESIPLGRLAADSSAPTSIPVTMSWSGSDGSGSGVRNFVLQRSMNGAAYATVATLTGTSRTLSLAPGSTFVFRVRATDNAGNISAWAYGRAFLVAVYQDAHAAVSYAGPWTITTSPALYAGTSHASTHAGDAASITVCKVLDVAFVSALRPSSGSAYLSVDGTRVATVNLYASSVSTRQLVFARRFASAADHPLRVTVVGTPGHRRVEIDAFVALQQPSPHCG